jgi:hypothetical protein
MTELSTSESFIVRIYRIDTDDRRKLTGIVEMTNGTEERTPFIDAEELVSALHSSVSKRIGRMRKTE